ncbi:Aph-1 protein, variant 2 [Balamuthia mandrillaris]
MRTHLLFILPFAVLFQEAMRWVFHKVYIRAEKGLTRESGGGANPFSFDYFSASLAIGLGFGVCQATIMYGTILTEAGGPGSLYTPACPHVSLFILSAVLALASIAMHVFLTIIAFDTFKTMAWRPFLFKCGIIVGGHLVISLMTLLNQEGGNCLASMVVIYVVLALIGAFALWLSFTSVHLLKRSAATNR